MLKYIQYEFNKTHEKGLEHFLWDCQDTQHKKGVETVNLKLK